MGTVSTKETEALRTKQLPQMFFFSSLPKVVAFRKPVDSTISNSWRWINSFPGSLLTTSGFNLFGKKARLIQIVFFGDKIFSPASSAFPSSMATTRFATISYFPLSFGTEPMVWSNSAATHPLPTYTYSANCSLSSPCYHTVLTVSLGLCSIFLSTRSCHIKLFPDCYCFWFGQQNKLLPSSFSV